MVVSRLKSALIQTKSLFGTMETEYLSSCTRSTTFMYLNSFLATYVLVHERKNYKWMEVSSVTSLYTFFRSLHMLRCKANQHLLKVRWCSSYCVDFIIKIQDNQIIPFIREFIIEINDSQNGKHYMQKCENNMSVKNKPTITKAKGKGFTQVKFIPDLKR